MSLFFFLLGASEARSGTSVGVLSPLVHSTLPLQRVRVGVVSSVATGGGRLMSLLFFLLDISEAGSGTSIGVPFPSVYCASLFQCMWAAGVLKPFITHVYEPAPAMELFTSIVNVRSRAAFMKPIEVAACVDINIAHFGLVRNILS